MRKKRDIQSERKKIPGRRPVFRGRRKKKKERSSAGRNGTAARGAAAAVGRYAAKKEREREKTKNVKKRREEEEEEEKPPQGLSMLVGLLHTTTTQPWATTDRPTTMRCFPTFLKQPRCAPIRSQLSFLLPFAIRHSTFLLSCLRNFIWFRVDSISIDLIWSERFPKSPAVDLDRWMNAEGITSWW